jgi:Flp pilus assembly protein TadG
MNIFDAICRRGRVMAANAHAERGSATIFVVGFALVLFASAGLAIDGGRAVNARDKATDIAEQAARAGAGQLDDLALRGPGGTVVLDQDKARATAKRFVEDAGPGYTATSTSTTNTVTVKAAKTYRTALLGIVGINSIDVSGYATANPATGINGATP